MLNDKMTDFNNVDMACTISRVNLFINQLVNIKQ